MKQELVDLHCHILPGIDDGSKDLTMTMELLRREVADGAAGVMFTPHFYYERISLEKFAERRRAAFRQTPRSGRRSTSPRRWPRWTCARSAFRAPPTCSSSCR